MTHRSTRDTLLAGVVLALALVVAWSRTFGAPFVLDDELNIVTNPSLREWSSAFRPPPEVSTGGRPLLNATLAANHALGGLDVRGYHAVNLAIHWAAALGLFALVRRTLASAPLRARFQSVAAPLALVAALAWALHPVQTESVTYVSQRAESLMGFFYFAVLFGVARSAEPGASRLWWLGAIGACLGGILTKETMLTAPLVALLYDRTFLAGTFRAAWRARGPLYAGLAGACVPLFWLTSGLTGRGIGSTATITPLTYLATECHVVVEYLKLCAWPEPLVFDHGPFTATALETAVGALLLGAGALATLFALRHAPALGFLGAAWFLVLAPTSSVVPVTFQPMAENRLYLPLAAVVGGALAFAQAATGRRLWLPAALALGAALALTLRRNEVYRDPIRLWAGTVAQRPDNPRAGNEYALSLARVGRNDEAIGAFERALARRPDAVPAHRNLALLLMRARRVEEALPHFAAIVALQPELASARQEYAHALLAAGRASEALAQFEAGVRLLPHDSGPRIELARTLLAAGRAPESLPHFAAALNLAPPDARLRYYHGIALLQSGRGREALAELEAARREDATLPQVDELLDAARAAAAR